MTESVPGLATAISMVELLDHKGIDWKRVKRTVYLIHQHLRYEYPGPIYDLNQRLMIIPASQHGMQRRLDYRLDVSHATFKMMQQNDDFGNREIKLSVPVVEQAIDFEAWVLVERSAEDRPYYCPVRWLTDKRLREPSPLTQPNEGLRRVAAGLIAGGKQGVALAQEINDWVHKNMSYTSEVTDISTTAAEVLVKMWGVCQDYAHLMIALCRLCGIAARYVSGHLLGEGGTHAWVEVLVPAGELLEEGLVVAFDPTHGCQTNLSYLTIAVGRDYFDVAPTSGTFRAAHSGQLSAKKRVGLTQFEYIDTLAS